MGCKAAHKYTRWLRAVKRPSDYKGTKGRKAAHQFVILPKGAKWLIILLRGLYPVFGKHPEFGEFTLLSIKGILKNVFFEL